MTSQWQLNRFPHILESMIHRLSPWLPQKERTISHKILALWELRSKWLTVSSPFFCLVSICFPSLSGIVESKEVGWKSVGVGQRMGKAQNPYSHDFSMVGKGGCGEVSASDSNRNFGWQGGWQTEMDCHKIRCLFC